MRLPARVRQRLLERLDRLGVFERIRLRNRRRTTILQYHGVTASHGSEALSFRRKHVEAKQFEAQMRWLHRRYNVVPVDRIVAHYRDGSPLPDRCAAVTFDDGFRNTYLMAYPVLGALALPATMFVPTDFVSGRGPLWLDRVEYALNRTARPSLALDILGISVPLRMTSDRERTESKRLLKNLIRDTSAALIAEVVAQLEDRAGVALTRESQLRGDYAPVTWDELREMRGSGLISVGSHTITHPFLPQCTPEAVRHELQGSKSLIEQMLGVSCRLFCYPNGEFDGGTRSAVQEAGYTGAVCSRLGVNDADTDVLAIKRIGVSGMLSMAEFAALVSGTLPMLWDIRGRTLGRFARA